MSQTELVWREVSAQKAVNAGNFAQGVIDFNFGVGAPTAWVPSKSYFKINMTLQAKDYSNPLLLREPLTSDMTAFADHAPSALFNNIYFRAGGQDVSSLVNYVPQAAVARTRLRKSGAWQKSIGSTAYMCEPNFQKRVNDITGGLEPGDIPTEVVSVQVPGVPQLGFTIAVDGQITLTNGTLARLATGDFLVVQGSTYRISNKQSDTQAFLAGAQRTADLVVTATGSDGVYGLKRTDGGGRNTVSALWQPPIGIFDHDVMGAGDYRIQLNPNSNYKTAAVESFQANSADYDLVVNDIKFYICTVKMAIPDGVSTLSLMEASVISKTIGAGEELRDFTVPASTKAISVFVQDQAAGSTATNPPTKYTIGTEDAERQLESLQLTYANVTKPATRWSSDYGPNTNQMQQRYVDTQIESGLIDNVGGAESFQDWMDRGPLYHFSYSKSMDDRATQLQISTKFKSGSFAGNAYLFVVAWHSVQCEIITEHGQIVSVRKLAV
jgi:hypothetical protein